MATRKKKKKNVSHSNDGAVVGWEILFTAMQNLSDEKKKKKSFGEDAQARIAHWRVSSPNRMRANCRAYDTIACNDAGID